MLIEGLVLSALAGGVIGVVENKMQTSKNKKISENSKQIIEIQRKWKNSLLDMPGKNMVNSSGKTFDLHYVQITKNGFRGKIKIPSGLNFDALEGCVNTLQDNFNGAIQIVKDKYDEHIEVEAITEKPLYVFKTIKLPCNVLFVGYKLNGDIMTIDLNKTPHLGISGITGVGKSVIKEMIVTNLIYNWKNDFDMYILQTVNNDDAMFERCKPVKMSADNFDDGLKLLKRLETIANDRAKKYKESGYTGFKDWNKGNPNNKDRRIVFLGDEFSFFTIEDGDNDAIKKHKVECERIFKRIAKAGRAMGINLIVIIQKLSSANINTTIRSQLAILSLTQFSSQDSTMAIGTDEAKKGKLTRCEAIISGVGIYEKLFLPSIRELEDESMSEQEYFNKFVPEIIVPNEKKHSLSNNKLDDLLEQTKILKDRAKKEYMTVWDSYKEITANKEGFNDIVVTNGLYDKEIIKFISNFGGITVKQATWMFYGHDNNARRALKRLESKGVLFSYRYSKSMKEKVFTTKECDKKLTYHEILINDFYSKLIYENAEILEFNRYPRIFDDEINTKSNTRRPDLYVRYIKDNKELVTYLEVDYGHPTNQEKINDYNKLWNKGKKFNIVIMKDGDLEFIYNGKMEIKHFPLNDFDIFPNN